MHSNITTTMLFFDVLLLTFLFPLCLCLNENPYNIPNPEFVVYDDGFSVSIPDESGIEIFFFYGSVNKVTAFLEPDTILMAAKEKIGDKWILKNNDTSPQVDEFIHYWLYVKKNGTDYKKEPDFYYVLDINRNSIESSVGSTSPALTPEIITTDVSQFPYQFDLSETPTKKPEEPKKPSNFRRPPVWGTIEDTPFVTDDIDSSSQNENKNPLPLSLDSGKISSDLEIVTAGPKLPSVVTRECENNSKYPLDKKLELGLIFDTSLYENPTPCPPKAIKSQATKTSVSPIPLPNVLSLDHGDENFNLSEHKFSKVFSLQPNIVNVQTAKRDIKKDTNSDKKSDDSTNTNSKKRVNSELIWAWSK